MPDYMRTVCELTGKPTIQQMVALAGLIRRENGKQFDPFELKDHYSRMLMEKVGIRRKLCRDDPSKIPEFSVPGAIDLLEGIARAGIGIHIASGSDQETLWQDVEALGLTGFFQADQVHGYDRAVHGTDGDAKVAVINRLITEQGLQPNELVILGDGNVEIALGKEKGISTVAVVSDETTPEDDTGVNSFLNKFNRLYPAGPNLIVTDFMAA